MDVKKLGPGNPPEELNVVIEIPHGSSIKYEFDKESGTMFVDRFVPPAMYYPINYGFVPGTHAEDGDALDVLLLTDMPMHPGTAIKCRPLGVLEMEDEEGPDNKVIVVPIEKVDLVMASVQNIDDISDPVRKRIKHFFDHYKDLEEDKFVKTGKFLGKDAAIEEINKTLQ